MEKIIIESKTYGTKVVLIDDGDGLFLEVPAFRVNGPTGEIELIKEPTYSYDLQQIIPPRLPYPRHRRHVYAVLPSRREYLHHNSCLEPDLPKSGSY